MADFHHSLHVPFLTSANRPQYDPNFGTESPVDFLFLGSVTKDEQDRHQHRSPACCADTRPNTQHAAKRRNARVRVSCDLHGHALEFPSMAENPLINVDLSRAFHPRSFELLIPLLPGLFVEGSVFLVRPELAWQLLSRTRLDRYGMLFLAVLAAFVAGSALMSGVRLIEICMLKIYRPASIWTSCSKVRDSGIKKGPTEVGPVGYSVSGDFANVALSAFHCRKQQPRLVHHCNTPVAVLLIGTTQPPTSPPHSLATGVVVADPQKLLNTTCGADWCVLVGGVFALPVESSKL